jgi:hypothetical protein
VGCCSTKGLGCLDSLIDCEFLVSAAWSSICLVTKYKVNAQHILELCEGNLIMRKTMEPDQNVELVLSYNIVDCRF